MDWVEFTWVVQGFLTGVELSIIVLLVSELIRRRRNRANRRTD